MGRISAKVHQHLMNLGGIGKYSAKAALDVLLYLNGRRQRCPEQLEGLLDNVADL